MCGGRCERDPPLYLDLIALPTQPVFLNGLTETMMSPTYVYTTSVLNLRFRFSRIDSFVSVGSEIMSLYP